VTEADTAVDTPVSLIDLAPTLAQLARAVLSDEAQGISLVPALQGQAIAAHPVYSEELFRVPFNQQAIRSDGYKLIYSDSDGHAQLYDLNADPGESHDLAADMPQVALGLRNRLLQWKAAMRRLSLTGLPHSSESDTTAGKLW
jgi:arylsulfatase A-like enzyme